MSIIPDPTNPEGAAITDTGDLAFSVFVAPVGADPRDPASWTHAGWTTDGFTGPVLARKEDPHCGDECPFAACPTCPFQPEETR